MFKSMYGKMSDNRSDQTSPNCGLSLPIKEGHMSKEEMKEYINEKMEGADYCETEMIYGLILGLLGE